MIPQALPRLLQRSGDSFLPMQRYPKKCLNGIRKTFIPKQKLKRHPAAALLPVYHSADRRFGDAHSFLHGIAIAQVVSPVRRRCSAFFHSIHLRIQSFFAARAGADNRYPQCRRKPRQIHLYPAFSGFVHQIDANHDIGGDFQRL